MNNQPNPNNPPPTSPPFPKAQGAFDEREPDGVTQSPPNSNTTPDNIPPSNNYKLIIAFLLILLLAASATAAYFYLNPQANEARKIANQQDNPTQITTTPENILASWNSYEDQEHLISFKYPPSWTAQPLDIDGGNGIATISDPNILNPQPGIDDWVVLIKYQNNENRLSLKEYHEDIRTQSAPRGMMPPNYYSESAENITLDGHSTTILKNQNCEPAQCDKYLIPINDKIFEISVFTDNLTEQSKETINQILSTFQFTIQNQPTPKSLRPPDENAVRDPETGQWVLENELGIFGSQQEIDTITQNYNATVTIDVPQTSTYQLKFPVQSLDELKTIKAELEAQDYDVSLVNLMTPL